MRTSRRLFTAFSSLILACHFGEQVVAYGQKSSIAPSIAIGANAIGADRGRDFAFTGAGSCSAAGCHGGNGTRPKFALAHRSTENYSSHSTWIQQDAHSRAYQVLLEEKSRRMFELLKNKGWAEPHLEKRCLSCHSTFDPSSSVVATDLERKQDQQVLLNHDRLLEGVSCESCHGAARDWLGPHTESSWHSLSSQARSTLGFRELRENLVERARTCAACHVGGAGRDMNHDMIAAGHPRLFFELSAFHANMPAHWSHEQDRLAFPPQNAAAAKSGKESIRETKLWWVGQLATAEAALNLVEFRAKMVNAGEGVWPEFSEYSCYACHHDLQSPSWRQRVPLAGRKPGSYPWGSWTFPLLDSLSLEPIEQQAAELPWSPHLQQLNTAMSRPLPATDEVLKHAQAARQAIAQTLETHRLPSSLTALQTQSLLQRVIRDGQRISSQDWDGAAQTYLAAISLSQGRLEAIGQSARWKSPLAEDLQLQTSLTHLQAKLAFPEPKSASEKNDSPRDFDAMRIEIIRQELQRIEDLVKQPVGNP